ncbi:hypothetical protein [Pedobacter sp. MC2016-24]|uniref:hypothetical protein n=1 Tax=Pedobacter sp. MC2016-24 TaxID=2780090 RepID=UPI0018825E2A|nr:hypothetical protein [Pedobacter sp. MC2016-24]MBE9603155.1 hypothetical protein [Pedobacter sp. MC2016-24]
MKKIFSLLIILGFGAKLQAQTVKPLSLTEYLKDGTRLNAVFKVESAKDILTISGYEGKDTVSTSKQVVLARGEVLGINSFKFLPPTVSILTIPVKVRNKTGSLPSNATSGLTNIGLNFTFPEYTIDRYFSSGNKSTHKFAAGIHFAPSVEELSPENTNNQVLVKSKQLFLSSGITLTYTYNNISLALVPLGFDFATTSLGKQFVYNKKSWWGFGIGIEPKLFFPTANK